MNKLSSQNYTQKKILYILQETHSHAEAHT